MNHLIFLTLITASCHSQDEYCQDINKPPNPSSGCCGIQLANDDFEISGDVADHQFPWLALIENQWGTKSYTGTLISSRHVLTPSFFIIYDRIMVHLGVFNRNLNGPDCVTTKGKRICNDSAVTIRAATIRGHDVNTTYRFLVDDIAVVKLAEKAPYNDKFNQPPTCPTIVEVQIEFIRPICLPTSDVLVSPPDNLRFIKAIWSRRPSSYNEYVVVKHYVTLPYVNQKKCQELYKSLPLTSNFVINNEMCAGAEKSSGGSNDYEGGPLILKENGYYSVIGMVEYFTPFRSTAAVPEIFQRVYPLLSWINSVIAEL